MPPGANLAAFALAAAVLIAVPGPSVLFVIGRSLSSGRRVGVLTVLGFHHPLSGTSGIRDRRAEPDGPGSHCSFVRCQQSDYEPPTSSRHHTSQEGSVRRRLG
jgi:hypothetical protein